MTYEGRFAEGFGFFVDCGGWLWLVIYTTMDAKVGSAWLTVVVWLFTFFLCRLVELLAVPSRSCGRETVLLHLEACFPQLCWLIVCMALLCSAVICDGSQRGRFAIRHRSLAWV